MDTGSTKTASVHVLPAPKPKPQERFYPMTGNNEAANYLDWDMHMQEQGMISDEKRDNVIHLPL